MKGKQFLLTTQIYLFLALGKRQSHFNLWPLRELTEAAAHSRKSPERGCRLDLLDTITAHSPFPF